MNHPVGSFCFAELHTGDPERMVRFYGALFGWTARQLSDTYWMFAAGSTDVVGMRRSSLHRWVACLRVGDVETILSRAVDAGLTTIQASIETPGVATVTLLLDPEGAVLGLWESHGVEGTSLETGPGSLWWVELATGDMETARRRYTSVFEWSADHTMKFDNGPLGYTLFKVGDRSVAGAFQFEPEWGVRPAWQVYFEVSDFDATAARACELGGQMTFVRDAPNAGRIGVLEDPGGGLFCVGQPLTP